MSRSSVDFALFVECTYNVRVRRVLRDYLSTALAKNLCCMIDHEVDGFFLFFLWLNRFYSGM